MQFVMDQLHQNNTALVVEREWNSDRAFLTRPRFESCCWHLNSQALSPFCLGLSFRLILRLSPPPYSIRLNTQSQKRKRSSQSSHPSSHPPPEAFAGSHRQPSRPWARAAAPPTTDLNFEGTNPKTLDSF